MDGSPVLVPDGIEPIVGYRAWLYSLGSRQAQLYSLNSAREGEFGGGWDGAGPSWVVACCRGGDPDPEHVAPEDDCTCGFYAVKRLRQLLDGKVISWIHFVPGMSELFHATEIPAVEAEIAYGMVLGRVELAGKIIEHKRGYRAERARIAELIPVRGTERTAIRLAARLGVPIGPAIAPPTIDPSL